MKTFDQFVAESALTEASYSKVRDWVFNKLENSDMDSDEMRKEFVKAFGRGAMRHYEKAVSEYMD